MGWEEGGKITETGKKGPVHQSILKGPVTFKGGSWADQGKLARK